MWTIPASYIQFMRRRNLTWDMKVNIEGVDYGRDVVMDFTIDRRLTSGDAFEIGTVNLGKLEMKLKLQKELPSNAKIIPYLALDTGSLSWEEANIPWQEANFPWNGGNLGWIPMGEFYVDSRERVKNIWVYTCFDRLYLADGAFLSNLTYPATMQAVWNEICTRLGYTFDSSVVINPNYKIPAGPAGFTMRQVMGFIASANGASVYMGRDGVVRFKRFMANQSSQFDMTEADYFRAKLTNPLRTYRRVVVQYDGEDGIHYEAGNGSEAETLYVDNPYATQAMANALLAQLNGFSYMPMEMDSRGYPHLEPGDVIQFEQTQSMAWQDANISWQDAHFPWDGVYRHQTTILVQSFTYRGGLVLSMQSPSISDQQSEFPTPGTITQEINRMNREAVKLGRKYYGVGFSREQGFQLNREDGLSEVIWNSDVMDWKVNGERVLYLDAQAKKLKFSGDLEAANGTFRGDLWAAGGTFKGTLQGVDGYFTGTVQAGKMIGGEIIGTSMSAATITGGQINGTNIIGADILGSRIRTATSGDRIELDPDGFKFYDSGNRARVALGTNQVANISGHTYYSSGGSSQGLIYAIDNEMHVFGNQNLRLGASYGKTYLQGDVVYTGGTIEFNGMVDFTNATVIGLK